MKVALINRGGFQTGTGKYAIELYKEIEKLQKNVRFFQAVQKDSEKYPSFVEKLQPKLSIPFLPRKAIEFANLMIGYEHAIPSGFDIYHVSDQTEMHYLNNTNGKKVATIHDMIAVMPEYKTSFFYRNLSNHAFKHAKNMDEIITVSEDSKKDVVGMLDIPDEKVTAVHEGVNHEIYRELNKETCKKELGLQGKKVVMHVGSSEPRKNFETVLNAFNEVLKHEKNAILLKIGGIGRSDEMLIEKLGIAGKIVKMKGLSEYQLAVAYNSSDVLLFPSIKEGFGLPPLEAMACGTPVITSNQSSMPEVVGNAGIKLKPYDVQRFAENALKLLENKKIWKEWSKKALERAGNFTWKKAAENTLKVYQKALGSQM